MPRRASDYLSRRPQLLKEFDQTVKHIQPVLGRYFTLEQVPVLIQETRQEYSGIIPQLPDLGGKQPFTQFIISTGMLLAVYRVAKAYGKSIEEIGELIYEIGGAYLKAYPAFLMRLFGKMNFSQFYLRRLQKRALESHRRQYPGDYVYNFVAGDGQHFDYGVDYLECASCKFLAKQNASELAPYLCAVDILYSRLLGWGLTRTMTLAQGAEKCDFRFKHGGPTNVAVPAALLPVINRNGGLLVENLPLVSRLQSCCSNRYLMWRPR